MHSHFPDLVTPVDEPGVVYQDVDLLEVLREEVEELCFAGRFEGLGWEISEGLVRKVSRRFECGFRKKGCNREAKGGRDSLARSACANPQNT